MFTKKHLVYVVFALLAVAVLPVEAALQMPNYASGGGNLTADVQSKGKAITDIASMIVAIVAILGIIIGGGKIAFGQGEEGKKWLIGGIAGIAIAGMAYGIASLVA